MRILIVGAGSVGQLYGYFLAEGGAHVDAYVRPKYAATAREGFRLYDRSKGLSTPLRFQPRAVVSSESQLQDRSYDAALFCIPSTGLEGPWLPPFLEALGEDCHVISLLPGIDDRATLAEWIPDRRLATGLITAVAYPAPLPGESVDEPGTAFWLPPLTPAFFQGPRDVIAPLIAHLKSGGMSARRHRRTDQLSAFGSAVLMPLVAILETLDWSLADLKRNAPARRRLSQTTDEVMAIVSASIDATPPLSIRLLGPTTWRGALTFAPWIAPFDLQAYLELHFTKVGDQTRLFFRDYIDKGRIHQLPTEQCQSLLDDLT